MSFEEFLFRLAGCLMAFSLIGYYMNGKQLSDTFAFAGCVGMWLTIGGALIAFFEMVKFIFDYVKGFF